MRGFYPCFNGIRVGTKKKHKKGEPDIIVSILVLMELGLEQDRLLDTGYFTNLVSILVLMELGLELKVCLTMAYMRGRFYPCFNGIRVGTN